MSVESAVKLSPQLRHVAEAISLLLDGIAGEHVMFAIHIFGDGDPGTPGQYIANCKREDVAANMRALLALWERTGFVDGGPLHNESGSDH